MTKKRVLTAAGVFLMLSFGLVAIGYFGIGKSGEPPIPQDKYPWVPDEALLNQLTPTEDDGSICVAVEADGIHVGMTRTEGVDFSAGAAPTWAKQAAYAAAVNKVIASYNSTHAERLCDDGSEAQAGYEKFCDGCGGEGCCTWGCPGVQDMSWCYDITPPWNCTKQYVCCHPPCAYGHGCGWCYNTP
jgi:hypothetical protein